MKVTTVTYLRKNAKAMLEMAHKDLDILIVRRKENKDMVLMSLEEYDELIANCSRLKA